MLRAGWVHRGATVAALIALQAIAAHPAQGGCNLIPGTSKSFNSTTGATNRPFAGPGERLEVRARPCDRRSIGLGATAADHLVTVIFRPPSGPRHAVVLTSDPDCTSLTAELAACQAQLTGGGLALCLPQNEAGLQMVDRNGVSFLSFRFPDTDAKCLGGPNAGKPCTDAADCAPGSCDPDDDDLTLAGPAVVAVSRPGDPLPCGLASSTCAAQQGLRACIDDFFANDGACGTDVALGSFPSFTALPPPNPFHLDCFRDSPPCNPIEPSVRAAVDSGGNLLFPVAWDGVLVRDQGIPAPRLLRTRFKSPFLPLLPFSVPDQIFLGSFTPEGGQLPPIFEPQLDPTVVDPDVVTLFGSTDVPYSILRIGKRYGICSGPVRNGQPCSIDTDCPGGSCALSCVDAPHGPCTVDGDCPTGVCGRLFDFGASSLLPIPRTLGGATASASSRRTPRAPSARRAPARHRATCASATASRPRRR